MDDELFIVGVGLAAVLVIARNRAAAKAPPPGSAPVPAVPKTTDAIAIVDRDGQTVATAAFAAVAGNPEFIAIYACDKAGVSFCAKIDRAFADAQAWVAKTIPGASLVLAGVDKIGDGIKWVGNKAGDLLPWNW